MDINAIVTRFSMEVLGADGTTERKLYFRHLSFLEIHGDKAVFNEPIVEYHVDELGDHTATLSYEADDGRKLIVRIDRYDESVQANPFNLKKSFSFWRLMQMDNQTDKLIAIRIDSALSSCFEIISKLMYMKTIGSDTEDGRNRLMDELDEIVDIDRAIILDLKGLNVLI